MRQMEPMITSFLARHGINTSDSYIEKIISRITGKPVNFNCCELDIANMTCEQLCAVIESRYKIMLIVDALRTSNHFEGDTSSLIMNLKELQKIRKDIKANVRKKYSEDNYVLAKPKTIIHKVLNEVGMDDRTKEPTSKPTFSDCDKRTFDVIIRSMLLTSNLNLSDTQLLSRVKEETNIPLKKLTDKDCEVSHDEVGNILLDKYTINLGNGCCCFTEEHRRRLDNIKEAIDKNVLELGITFDCTDIAKTLKYIATNKK